jgi:hypothetical protein
MNDRLEALFYRATACSSEEREQFLLRECADDPELLTELRRLLAGDDVSAAAEFWEYSAIENEAQALAKEAYGRNSGELFGRYRLEGLIAEGGMGEVYRARDIELDRPVALKSIRASVQTDALLRRFGQERQILAQLNHVNIARLLDVGTSNDGKPFLVMEYVEGVSIDRFLQDHNVPVRELLRLFRKVCSAVSYAHENLIVHRDLKPGNILVMADGTPKLLDFGIAKLLDGGGDRTETGLAAMTPAYASPEQIQGRPVTSRSDVYSLGVLLYELLSGAKPYRKTGSPRELVDAICNETPQPLTLDRVGDRMDRDLDVILQTALRKEPERRYASVEQFSEDIRRFLDGYPVSARLDARSYRLTKFVSRNRIPIAAAALFAIAITGGVLATVRQARIANRRFNDVRKLAHSYLFEVYDGLRDLEGATALRQLVVKRALEYLGNLSEEQGGDAGLSRELASAYARVGMLQGEPGFPNLGDPLGALESYRKAVAIRRRLMTAAPSNMDAGLELAESYRALGNLLAFQRDTSGAADNLRRAVAISEKLASAHPIDLHVRDSLALSYTFLGNVTGNNEYANLGDQKGAQQLYEKARDIRETIAAKNSGDRMNRLNLATIFEKIAAICRTQRQDPAAAEAFLRAIAIGELLSKEDPVNVLYRHQIAVDSRSLSLTYMALKNFPEARRTGDRSAGIFEELALADVKNIQAQEEVADSYWSQGFVLEGEKNFNGAYERYEASIAAYQKLMQSRPGYFPNAMRTAYQLVAGLSAKLGDTTRTHSAAQKEIEMDERMLRISPNDVGPKLNRGVALLQIGQAHQTRAEKTGEAAEWRQALNWSLKSMEVWSDLKKQGVLNPGYAAFVPRTQGVIDRSNRALM